MKTLLHAVKTNAKKKTIAALFDVAKILDRDETGKNCLHYAVMHNRIGLVREIIEACPSAILAMDKDLKKPGEYARIDTSSGQEILQMFSARVLFKDMKYSDDLKTVTVDAKSFNMCVIAAGTCKFMENQVSRDVEMMEQLLNEHDKLKEKNADNEMKISNYEKLMALANEREITRYIQYDHALQACKALASQCEKLKETFNVTNEDTSICSICMEHEKKVALIACGHCLCKSCGDTFRKKKCPFCSQVSNKYIPIYF